MKLDPKHEAKALFGACALLYLLGLAVLLLGTGHALR